MRPQAKAGKKWGKGSYDESIYIPQHFNFDRNLVFAAENFVIPPRLFCDVALPCLMVYDSKGLCQLIPKPIQSPKFHQVTKQPELVEREAEAVDVGQKVSILGQWYSKIGAATVIYSWRKIEMVSESNC